jgi:periplasmic protein TonB
MRPHVIVVLLAMLSVSQATAQTSIRAPAPMYPLECRARGITGSGVVLATVDERTGAVIGARMLKSTGNRLLDASALEALSRWRFKPGTVSQVKIPINFTMAAKR